MSGFVVCIFSAMVALSALVFDGARLVAARATIDDHAANAARSAAQEIIDIRLNDERIDPEAGSVAAHRYLAENGLVGRVQIEGMRVQVTVSDTVTMTLLALVGVGDQVVQTTRHVRVVDE